MFKFDKNINEFLKIITKSAQNDNVRVFFVGGIVRDALLGQKTKDIDIIIEGNAIDFCKKNETLFEIQSIHEDFGTVKVKYKNTEIDIASTRMEKYPTSGCLPVVTKLGVPIEKDVCRRDFTINSMYIELKNVDNKIQYNLIDLISAQQDLKNKILKSLHNKSYIDDPTRIIRGINFKHRFNFDFSQNDKELISSYIKNIDRNNMSLDRIYSVFKLAFSSEKYKENFKEIIEKKYYKIINDCDLEVNLDKTLETINIFKLNNKEISEFLFKIITNQNISAENFTKNTEILNHFSKMEIHQQAYYFYKTNSEYIKKYLSFKNIMLQISGKNLIELGYSQGPLFGKILNELLEEKLGHNSKFATLDDEINWVLKHYPKN